MESDPVMVANFMAIKDGDLDLSSDRIKNLAEHFSNSEYAHAQIQLEKDAPAVPMHVVLLLPSLAGILRAVATAVLKKDVWFLAEGGKELDLSTFSQSQGKLFSTMTRYKQLSIWVVVVVAWALQPDALSIRPQSRLLLGSFDFLWRGAMGVYEFAG